MSAYNQNTTTVDKEALERGELQLNLMKVMAEESRDKFLEYYRENDTIILSEIIDGCFREVEVVEGFISRENMVLNRIYDKDQESYRDQIRACLVKPKTSVFEVRYVIPDVGPRWYRMYLMSVADENGYVTKFVARMVNIQSLKEAQESMTKQAERDSLSGVYNHATYEKLCTELADRVDNGLLYLMVDIDNFKQINDINGHHAGDEVIEQVGMVLERFAKGRGYAGRIGGDEFSICFYDIHSQHSVKALQSLLRPHQFQ